MATGKAGSLLIDIAANTAQLKKDMGEASAAITAFAKTAEFAGQVLKTALSFEIAREVISTLVELTKTVGDLADQARRVGLSTDDFQAFTIAMQKAGASASEAQSVLASGQRFLGQAMEGNKQSIELLNRLNVAILNSSGKAKPFTTDLQNLAIAILKIQDPLKQAGAAQEIFHKSAAEVLPILHELALGFENMRASAGPAIIPQDTIDRFNDFATALKTTARVALADFAVAVDNLYGGQKTVDGFKAIQKSVDDLGLSLRILSSSEFGTWMADDFAKFQKTMAATVDEVRAIVDFFVRLPGIIELGNDQY